MCWSYVSAIEVSVLGHLSSKFLLVDEEKKYEIMRNVVTTPRFIYSVLVAVSEREQENTPHTQKIRFRRVSGIFLVQRILFVRMVTVKEDARRVYSYWKTCRRKSSN
ncbi:hypothetical protein G210_2441 [Candida maltosa Xu316]|uniref:Uncharacterized protein n=1 Tax=Candida maltosa (strain Xu316) TaxID=1245528 RepID=M3JWC1_CANMX|nr:hypothetical protein G210_2441 [Candida maltosa Xu316]